MTDPPHQRGLLYLAHQPQSRALTSFPLQPSSATVNREHRLLLDTASQRKTHLCDQLLSRAMATDRRQHTTTSSSTDELRAQLRAIPRMKQTVADRIVENRPFTISKDMAERVEGLGKKL
eukprot:6430909-Prymnesium_polylepis.1